MKVKQKAKRVVSGLLTAVTLLSTVLSPISSYAAELPKERKLPLLEEVQSQLDEDEIVLAKDHQVEVGTSFDVKTDFTGLEIKNAAKVKITFEEAKNEQGEDFTTSHADTYKTVYHSEDDNPLGVKSDFILSLCELIMGSRDGIEAEEKSVIDRCLPLVYQNYFSDPKPENMPTLGDLYDCLRKQKEPQAQRIATALEIYVNGSLKVFNHQTNVELNNRIVCFDIKELGKQLKKLGMLIIQDQVWNRVTINRGVKSTWYYIDEFHLLLKEEQTASYSVEIFKRFRKWGGIPTGITQNIKDLLSSREIENIFENSDFILMLNQAAGDRQILAKQLNISPYQLSYVTNSGEGEGLLFYGTTIIPFKDKFDKSLKLYSLMTTKPEEVEQREKEGGGSLGRERTERKRESCQ